MLLILSAIVALASATTPPGWPTEKLGQMPMPNPWPENFYRQSPIKRAQDVVKTVSPEVEDVSQVSLVIVGVRNGNNNPMDSIKNNPTTVYTVEGPRQLTKVGKRQAYAMGRALRKRYSNLLNENYNPTEVRAFSSNESRAQMTMQTLMAGLYPVTEDYAWNPDVKWQPIPIDTHNEMLRVNNITCPTAQNAWRMITAESIPELRNWLNRESEFVNYVKQNTGTQGTLRDMAMVADNVYNMQMRGMKMPDWIESPKVSQMSKETVYKLLQEFREVQNLACSRQTQCKRIMAGYWLYDVVRMIQERQTHRNMDRKMVVYTTATETIHSFMNLAKVDYQQYTIGMVPQSGGFIIEYRDQPTPGVRVVLHEPVQEDPDKRNFLVGKMLNCRVDQGHWCPVNTFLQSVQDVVITDWRRGCQVSECQEEKNYPWKPEKEYKPDTDTVPVDWQNL